VLCPDYPSFGALTGYDFAADEYVSGTMKGVVNHMRCVDLLRARDDVDGERIGVIGHSLGGHNAMFVAAFDERIKAVVSSCGWTPFGDYYGGKIAGWTSDRYMPRLRDVYGLDPKKVPFDFYEVVAALAPRPFLSLSPVRDDNFDVNGVKKGVAAAQKVYELLGAPQNLQARYPDVAHDFTPEMRQEAYAFLDKALGNSAGGSGAPSQPDFGAELPRIPPKEPAEALKTFQVLPGFRIELAAAEPLVRDPVAMAFDENGRLFVVEMVDYSEQDKEFLGTVRLLEDGDGDGAFEKSIVYADRLSWPTAIACWDGGVFVGAAPDVLYLKDGDGDGKADKPGERRVVFTGFSRGNVQGLLNSFHWTLDNRMHGATSLSGGKVTALPPPGVRTQPPAPVNLSGRDFSFDPRLLDLRPESGGAQHGLSFDDWGRKFVCSNSDHIQMVMFEDRYLAASPNFPAPSPRVSIAADGPQAKVFRISPVEPWRIVRTRLRVAGLAPGPIEGGGQPAGYFTGSTGTTIYRGDAFGPEYIGQAFIGDVGSNIIHRKVLEPDGVGLVAKRVDEGKEFVASTDNWFRPAQFANGPDGALYVADMYREVIEHPASLPPEIKKHLDLTSGRDRGRIYRIVPKGFKRRPPPRLGEMTTGQLVALLEHRNGWHRETASRLLFQRQDRGAVAPLEALLASSRMPEARVHALYALSGLKSLTPHTLLRALNEEHRRVREHAVRLSEGHLGRSEDLRANVLSLVNDPDPRVRYQLAFSLTALPVPDTVAPVTSLLKRAGGDPWLRFAALLALSDGTRDVIPGLLTDEQFLRTPQAHEVLRALATRVAASGDTRAVSDLMQAVGPAAARDKPLGLAVLKGIADGLPNDAPLRKVLPGGVPGPLVNEMIASARALATEQTVPVATRVEAARVLPLGTFADAEPVLRELLAGRHPHEVQLAAVESLGRFDDDGVGRLLVAAWPGLTPRLRAAAAEVIFSRARNAAPFLDAVGAGKIPAADLDASRLKLLAGGGDKALAARAEKLLSQRQSSGRDEVVAKYRPALEMKGDPDKGRTLFRATCAACHQLEGFGHEIGPSLAAMQARGPETILVNVIDPNREITPQFVEYIVATTDGRTLTGMLAAETASSVTLRRAENATDVVPRNQIKQLRGGRVSIMPEGLEQQMSVQDMADLIAYIMTVK
jgi:putative membrane-bound dehydrogenase-like protein